MYYNKCNNYKINRVDLYKELNKQNKQENNYTICITERFHLDIKRYIKIYRHNLKR